MANEQPNTGQPNTQGAPDAAADKAAADKAAADKAASDKAASDKAASDKAAADKAAADKANAPPEKYEFKGPDGAELDAETVTEFSGVAKEFGLSQEKASKIYGIGAKAIAKRDAQIKKFVEDTQAGWRSASEKDSEFGGEKLKENLAIAAKARDAFGTPELKKVLDETGLGDHPEMIRAFYRAGKAISEDRLVVGNSQPKPQVGTPVFTYDKSKHV